MDGTPFGRYRLIELLGRGGMGEVWRALDPATDRIVAIKVLPANFADDQVFQERFRREARAAAGLNDPHVVPIHYFGEIEGRLYVDMRLINGRDLQELLDDGPLAPARAVGIIEQIASALEAAHEVGLVHRDVKPSNILVAADDFAYLIDFGIARIAGETGLTSTGATIGTWAYMAPERFRKGIADARTDIYALACVLYQSLTGQLPFRGDTLEQIAVAHLMDPPPKPSLARDGVPPELDQVIATGMAKYPERRYPTSKDLAQAARAALTTPVPHLSPPGPPPTATPPSSGEGRPDGETTRAAAESTGIQESPTDGMPAFSRGAGTGETTTQTAPTESVGNAPTQYAPNNGHDNMSRRPGRTAAVVVSVVGALAVIATGVALWVSQRKSPAPHAPSSSSSSEAAPALSTSFGPSPPSESAPAPVPVPVPSDSASTQITYTVTGTKAPGDIVSVSFVDSTGTTRTQRNIAIPWSYTLTLASPPKVGSLQASSLFKMSTLNCSITTADGTVLSATRDNSPVVSC